MKERRRGIIRDTLGTACCGLPCAVRMVFSSLPQFCSLQYSSHITPPPESRGQNTIMRTQRLLAAAVSRLLTSRQRKKSDFFPLQINKTHAVINHWSEKKLRLQHSSYQHSDTRGARVQNPLVRISMVNDFDDVQ